MKKMIVLILITSLVFSSVGVFASTNDQNYGQANNKSIQSVLNAFKSISEVIGELIQKFSDLKGHWAMDYVAELFTKGSIAGYTDGTFKPNGDITRAEFTKIMVTSLAEDPGNYSAGHWATNYINAAVSEGYIKKGEFDNLDKAITRGEMARMISRALKETPANIEVLKNQITDFSQITREFQNDIAKVYAAGIITGYPDGTFGAERTATRAEAATMLIRLLESDKRVVPELVVEKPKEEKPVEKPKSDFIEPEFVVKYIPHYRRYEGYFSLELKNKNQYKESDDEYEMKIICTNHKELNLYYNRDIFGDMSWYINDKTTWEKAEYAGWVLFDSFFTKPNEEYVVSPDTEVELEITLRNKTKGTEKIYKRTIKATE